METKRKCVLIYNGLATVKYFPETFQELKVELAKFVENDLTKIDKREIFYFEEGKKVPIQNDEDLAKLKEKNLPKTEIRMVNKKKDYVVVGYGCDACRSVIQEKIRYHCTFCDNFDYCEKCFLEKGLEHGHNFYIFAGDDFYGNAQ